MSKGNRRENFTFGVVAATIGAIAVLAVATFAFTNSRSNHQNQRDHAASAYGEQEQEKSRADCIQSRNGRTFSCTIDTPAAPNNQKYSHYDLQAQQEMAEIAELGAAISLIGVLITFVGVVYVALTLREARTTTQAAKDAVIATNIANATFAEHSRRELRAYVGAFDVRAENLFAGRKPRFLYNIVNYGQTPARELEAFAMVLGFAAPETAETFKVWRKEGGRIPFASKIDLGPGQPAPVVTDSNVILTREMKEELGITGSILFCGIIRYRDVFGARHWTIFRHYLAPHLVTQEGTASLTACRKNNRTN